MKKVKKVKKVKKINLGIEIEREGVAEVFVNARLSHDFEDISQDLVKRDGSLQDWGAEFVSRRLTIKNLNDIKNYLFNNYLLRAFFYEGHVEDSCGFHVHVGDARLTRKIEKNFYEVKNFILYFLRYYFQLSRRHNDYIEWDITDFTSHYSVLNSRGGGHLEFRGFGGVDDLDVAEKKAIYALAILSILKNLNKVDTSFLTFRKYLNVIENDSYNNLRFFRRAKKNLFLNLIDEVIAIEKNPIYRDALIRLCEDVKYTSNFYFK